LTGARRRERRAQEGAAATAVVVKPREKIVEDHSLVECGQNAFLDGPKREISTENHCEKDN
jgi:hypothetical protein